MNVDIRPLVWVPLGGEGDFEARTPLGDFTAEAGNPMFNESPFVCAFEGRALSGHSTLGLAKRAAERWYTLAVLDTLEPLDQDSALRMLTMRDQCSGLYDSNKGA